MANTSEVAAIERPILFSGPMVRAIFDGKKTQTRRVVKPQFQQMWGSGVRWNDSVFSLHVDIKEPDGQWKWIRCPYGKAGDRLWVRETFATSQDNPGMSEPGVVYRATDPDWSEMEGFKWKPSIFMPRAASRITLEITDITVERLNDITGKDARAEGCPDNYKPEAEKASIDFMSCGWFANLWESINGAGSWDLNPWVWVVNFRKV